jgi:PAS domain-containing protein
METAEESRSNGALAASGRFSPATIDALSAQLCVLDENGTILATNRAWNEFAADYPPAPRRIGAGINYLAACDAATGGEAADAAAFAAGARAVIRGERASFAMEYACHTPTEERWFLGRVTREPSAGPVRVVVVHENITERKSAERKIREQLDELLRWQRVMLGRESRVMELKAEVNALLAAQGQPARYESPNLR